MVKSYPVKEVKMSRNNEGEPTYKEIADARIWGDDNHDWALDVLKTANPIKLKAVDAIFQRGIMSTRELELAVADELKERKP